MPLDAKTVEAAKPRQRTYRLSDGDGLLLEVTPKGARVWLCRVTVAKKRKDIGLGGYPTVSLKEAREKAKAVRKLAAKGLDPVVERERLAREREAAAVAAAEAERRTFRNIALACIEAQSPAWKNERTGQIWRSTFERHVFPVMGDTPVAEVDRAAVVRAVSPIWTKRPGIAPRLLQRIGVVLRFAVAHGWRDDDAAANLRLLVAAKLLTAPPSERGHPSIAWPRLPAFWQALARVDGLGAVALRLAILTALRSGEVRQARWSWVSFDATPTLTVPAHMMKGRKADRAQPHRVPLSPAALAVLAGAYSTAHGTPATVADLPRLATLARDALIFPNASRRAPISDMTLSAVLRRMNAKPEGAPSPWRDPDGREAVPHGFRASFSTWCDDTRPHEREAVEKALAHVVGNRASGAYRRSDLFDRRVGLMAEWAAHVTSAPATAGEVVPARKRRAESR